MGSARASFPPGYAFADTTGGDLAAAPVTMSIAQATIPNPQAHVAVWEMAVDSRGSWLSAGLLVQTGSLEPVVYVETGTHAYLQTSMRFIDQVPYGSPITIRITDSRLHGWVVWYDGRAVGSARLGPFAQRVSSGELYMGGAMRFVLRLPA